MHAVDVVRKAGWRDSKTVGKLFFIYNRTTLSPTPLASICNTQISDYNISTYKIQNVKLTSIKFVFLFYFFALRPQGGRGVGVAPLFL